MSDGPERYDHPSEEFYEATGVHTAAGEVVVKHTADHHQSFVLARPAEDGRPIPEGAELLTLREDGRYESSGTPASMRKGPSRVNSEAFRSGHDRVFGRKQSN